MPGPCFQQLTTSSGFAAMTLLAGLAWCAGPQEAHAQSDQPFKFMNVHFETNASGCDMGIQILFDTDGITELSVEDPDGVVVFSSETLPGMETTHDQTEGFQERVEPPITELENALGCDPSDDAISLAELLDAWPAGTYTFEARTVGVDYRGTTRLTHRIPAGPEIITPQEGTVVRAGEPLSDGRR